ncbi:hypothetical protein [Motiliproteus sp. MSK22-1]|uniref:hypothetical protein n=1 Tax=Motiliproteus sp. MSK22-1 TaxID=1897630 RepID=UPI000978882F|nr:hypothetical protein [Motiliproteus sp. MSK22-1]OMH39526.1 hypothetical protein BGP75_02745 [Motiliproteus sp. MSK22-1]
MKQIKASVAKFDALSVRERVLILVTVVVAILLPVFIYLIEPTQKKQIVLTTQVAKLKAANANKALDIQTLSMAKTTDPNEAIRTQLKLREQQLAALNETLKKRSGRLVSASEMLTQLEQVLSDYRGLRLVAVDKAEPQRFMIDSDSKDQEQGADMVSIETGLYRHDMKLVVEGGFFDVLSYLQALEQLPQGFFWDSIDYQVEEYPKAQVSLKVHTLSTEQGWLGV